MRTPTRLSDNRMDDQGDQNMDDILASIRRIIAEDPLVTRPVPASLGDAASKVPRTPDTPVAAIAAADSTESTPGLPAVAASPDDDLFEPETLDTDYVSPRPPRELIFRPSALPVDPEPAVRTTAQSPAEVWAAANAPAARMPATVAGSEVGPEVARQVETELPPVLNDVRYAEIVPEPMAAPMSENAPVLDAVDTIGATEFAPAAVNAIAVPDDAQFVTAIPLEAADARMNASIEDLLGALAAGLAQQVPSTPHVETIATPTEPVVGAKPPEVQLAENSVSDDEVPRTVADALAAIAAANIDAIANVETTTSFTDIAAGSDIAEPAPAISVVAAVETLPNGMPLVGGGTTVTSPVTLPDVAIDLGVMDVAVADVVETEAVAPPTIAAVVDLESPAVEAVSVPDIASAMPAMAAGLVAVGGVAVAAAASAAAEPVVAIVEAPQSLPAASATPPMEDAVSSLLRPLIKDWLDRNMPTLVEKALKDELKSRSEPTHKAE